MLRLIWLLLIILLVLVIVQIRAAAPPRTYLITVPHGACSDPIHRDCDRAAVAAADAVERTLEAVLTQTLDGNDKDFRIVRMNYTDTNVMRKMLDMNRTEARGSEWRRRVDAFIRGTPRLEWVIDVHSFPASAGGTFAGMNLVILDAGHGPRLDSQSEGMSTPRMTTARASKKNDILNIASKANRRAVLVEFAETLDQPGLERYAAEVVRGLDLSR